LIILWVCSVFSKSAILEVLQSHQQGVVAGGIAALKRAALAIVSLTLAMSVSVTIVAKPTLTILVASGDSPTLSVEAKQDLKDRIEEERAMKYTTNPANTARTTSSERDGNRENIIGGSASRQKSGRQEDQNHTEVLQSHQQGVVAGGIAALKRAILAIVSLTLAMSVSVTIVAKRLRFT